MDWPNSSRRMGATRREQNLALIVAVASGAAIAVAAVLLLLSRANPELATRLRGVATDLVAPVWGVARVPFDWVGEGFSSVGDYFGAVSRNQRLEQQLAVQAKTLESHAATLRENAQLHALLKVVEPGQRLIGVARIAGASSGSVVRSAIISAGRGQGILPGQPVRVAAGLVGRTTEAGAHSARVLLITDTNSRIPVTIVRTGQSALAVGTSGRLLELRDRVGAEVPLVAGDRLVTSGDGGVFAPGIPVGFIVDGGHDPALAQPMVNVAGLGLVMIEAPFLPVPQETTNAVSAVTVPREAGGGRSKSPIVSGTPRAVASAPSANTSAPSASSSAPSTNASAPSASQIKTASQPLVPKPDTTPQ